MTKSNRRALVRLAREKVVASTSEDFSDLARIGYAKKLGLIVTPGAKRPSTLRAGYQITDEGVKRASMYDEDGMVKSPPERP